MWNSLPPIDLNHAIIQYHQNFYLQLATYGVILLLFDPYTHFAIIYTAPDVELTLLTLTLATC